VQSLFADPSQLNFIGAYLDGAPPPPPPSLESFFVGNAGVKDSDAGLAGLTKQAEDFDRRLTEGLVSFMGLGVDVDDATKGKKGEKGKKPPTGNKAPASPKGTANSAPDKGATPAPAQQKQQASGAKAPVSPKAADKAASPAPSKATAPASPKAKPNKPAQPDIFSGWF
jgi:hypothetical protein